MTKTVLVTSFATWLFHHSSNSSDDLLLNVNRSGWKGAQIHVLRQLPVELNLASSSVIKACEQLKPDLIICCGMAENRDRLSLESRAVVDGQALHTSIELEELVKDLRITEISHDAGNFVCNSLYYLLLNHLHKLQYRNRCLFIHVPILTAQNRWLVWTDFQIIVQRLIDMKNSA
jgi:pyroglutamyl-peptidase